MARLTGHGADRPLAREERFEALAKAVKEKQDAQSRVCLSGEHERCQREGCKCPCHQQEAADG